METPNKPKDNNFFGNEKTKDSVMRRHLRQFESSWYSKSRVDRSKVRLAIQQVSNHQYFQYTYSINILNCISEKISNVKKKATDMADE